MPAIDMTTGQLPASKTHGTARRWSFVPANDCTLPTLGTITIVQGRRDADSYGVDVVDGEILFAKLDAEADVYAVRCDRAGKPVRCTCKGFSFKKTCKHLDTARELMAEGIIRIGG
jgi:hypothetical protein